MESIGRKIAELRKKKGLNQRDFAHQIGVSQPSLIKFEKGETDIIPLGVAIRISEVLHVSFLELFDISPDPGFGGYQTTVSALEGALKDYEQTIKSLYQELEQKDLTIQSLNTSRKALIEAIIRYIEEQPGNSIYWILKQGDDYAKNEKEKDILKEMVIDEGMKRQGLYDYFLNAGLFTKRDLDEVHKKINETYKNIDWEGVFKKLLRESEESKN